MMWQCGVVAVQLNLLMTNAVPGSELTKEPFRWDQRLFGVVLRIPATPPVEQLSYIPSADDTAIDAMCEVTGGMLRQLLHLSTTVWWWQNILLF